MKIVTFSSSHFSLLFDCCMCVRCVCQFRERIPTVKSENVCIVMNNVHARLQLLLWFVWKKKINSILGPNPNGTSNSTWEEINILRSQMKSLYLHKSNCRSTNKDKIAKIAKTSTEVVTHNLYHHLWIKMMCLLNARYINININIIRLTHLDMLENSFSRPTYVCK